MAASTCVSTSCSSVSGARKSLIYGRQPLGRSVFFYGKGVSVTGSLQGAQQWLSTAHAVSKSSKRSLIVASSSLLAEISSQTVVSENLNTTPNSRSWCMSWSIYLCVVALLSGLSFMSFSRAQDLELWQNISFRNGSWMQQSWWVFCKLLRICKCETFASCAIANVSSPTMICAFIETSSCDYVFVDWE